MTFGELKNIIEEFECKDDTEIQIRYTGDDIEIENGDSFLIQNEDYELYTYVGRDHLYLKIGY